MIEEIAAAATHAEIDQAIAEYADIGSFIDKGLKQQAEFDVDSFVLATGRNLTKMQREQMTANVLKAMRWTYLGTGMTHPHFLETVESINEDGRKQIEAMAPMFC